jgi:hypothetical protein
VLPILVFASSLTLAYALMQGNVGTAYRQRTQVTMFFFVFMAVGIVLRRQEVAGSTPILDVAAPSPADPVIRDRDFVFEQDFDVGRSRRE